MRRRQKTSPSQPSSPAAAAAAAPRLLVLLLLSQAACGTLAAHGPGTVGIPGIPVCPVGLPACGMHGCYTPLLSKCDPTSGCISVKILMQLSALVRFGSNNAAGHAAGACPVGFANSCGGRFCAMGEVCAGGVCQAGSGQQFSAHKVGNTAIAAKAACLAARYGSPACAGDSTDLATVDCNGIGVPSIKGIFCFQSQLFNCAVQPGGSATFTCRGMAGVAQAVTEVWNSTMSTAAQVAQEVADAISKQEREQQAAAAAAAKAKAKGGAAAGTPIVLADAIGRGGAGGSTYSSNNGGGSNSGGWGEGSSGVGAGQGWRAGAEAALDSLSHAVKERLSPDGQPILQPIFHNLANMVNNASKSLLNITADGVNAAAGDAKAALASKFQQTFDLGRPPVRDASGIEQCHTAVLLLTALLSAGLLLRL